MSKRAPALPPVKERELLRLRGVSELLGLSIPTVRRMKRDCLLPEPLNVMSMSCWRRRELIDWILAGMPDPGSWKWTPVLAVSLPVLLDLLRKQVVSLNQEIRELESRAAGETNVSVRRRLND